MKFKAFFLAFALAILAIPSAFAGQRYYADGADLGTFSETKCGYGVTCGSSSGNQVAVSVRNSYAADTASTDDYTIAPSPALTAYAAGIKVTFKAVTANTGACTVNVNGLGAKSLKRGVSTDPGDNYIKAGSIVEAVYDGTNFQMIQPAAQ